MEDIVTPSQGILFPPRDKSYGLENDLSDYLYYINIAPYNETYWAQELQKVFIGYKVPCLPLLRSLLDASYNFSDNEVISYKFKPTDLKFKKKSDIVRPL